MSSVWVFSTFGRPHFVQLSIFFRSVFLTHDSQAGRKQHNHGRRHQVYSFARLILASYPYRIFWRILRKMCAISTPLFLPITCKFRPRSTPWLLLPFLALEIQAARLPGVPPNQVWLANLDGDVYALLFFLFSQGSAPGGPPMGARPPIVIGGPGAVRPPFPAAPPHGLLPSSKYLLRAMLDFLFLKFIFYLIVKEFIFWPCFW